MQGFVPATEPGTAIRTMKPVVLMNKKNSRHLLPFLGRLIIVRYENVEQG